MSGHAYHSTAFSVLMQLKDISHLTAEDAVNAFDAIRVNLMHAALLAELVAAKSPDKGSRIHAHFLAWRAATLSKAAEQSTQAAAQAPSPKTHLPVVA